MGRWVGWGLKIWAHDFACSVQDWSWMIPLLCFMRFWIKIWSDETCNKMWSIYDSKRYIFVFDVHWFVQHMDFAYYVLMLAIFSEISLLKTREHFVFVENIWDKHLKKRCCNIKSTSFVLLLKPPSNHRKTGRLFMRNFGCVPFLPFFCSRTKITIFRLYPPSISLKSAK